MTTALLAKARVKLATSGWKAALLFVSLLLALPVIVIYASLSAWQTDVWQHLIATVLTDYLYNSLLLAFGAGGGAMLIGTGCAWLLTRYRFVGSTYFQWLLLLPLAMPAYIIAYTYTGMLDFAGPLQSYIRQLTGWGYGDYWFPEIRSLGGAIVMLSLVLYPYVFILSRTAFREQSASLQEACRSLGQSNRQYIWRVALPLARPAIFTGTALVMMEAFADYGTVQYFGVNTFTTGIFRTWFGMNSPLAAAQMAALLCTFVLCLLILEQHSRRKIQYFNRQQHSKPAAAKSLTGGYAALAWLGCGLPVVLGFVVPVVQLSYWAWLSGESQLNAELAKLAGNSLFLAAAAALIIVILAVLFSYGKRLFASKTLAAQVRLAGMGYAIPGTVIAVGVLLPLSWLDHGINGLLYDLFDYRPGLIFSGTLFALLLAYTVRFISVALHNTETGLARITPAMDQAARSLGAGTSALLGRIHLPLLRGSIISALLLVFVDVLKELPATLILRPFNFNTLAVRAFELTSDERLVDAALPSLAIVIVGLLPVVILTRAIRDPALGAD